METLPLAAYARVQAALGEGFPPAEILATFGLDAEAWHDAETKWLVEIARSAATLADYRVELARAEDVLARAVPPIDEDPSAWLAFTNAYAAEADPFGWLAAQDLGLNDVSRLVRKWSARFAQDDELAAKLPALREEARRAPPPRVRAAPRRKQEALDEAREVDQAAAPASGITGRLDAMAFAAIAARLEIAPDERARLLRERGLGEETFARVEAGYAVRLAADAELRRDVALLKEQYRERALRAGVAPVEAAPAIDAPPTVDDLEATLEVRTLEARLATQTWPFEPGPSRFAVPDLRRSSEVPSRDGTTAEVAGGIAPDPLPFVRTTPALTLRQHASLTVEIGLRREPVETILARYRVSAVEKAALDAFHGAAIQRDPALREAWREACGIYLAWLTGH